MRHLKLEVTDLSGLDMLRPVTGGVPLPPGAASAAAVYSLHDGRGRRYPVQSRVLARWMDGSTRWLLLDFQARPVPGASQPLTLTWSNGASPPRSGTLAGRREGRPALRTPEGLITAPAGRLLDLCQRLELQLELVLANGRRCRAVVESAQIQDQGPLRAAMVLCGAMQDQAGRRAMGFRLRCTVYGGLPFIRLEPMLRVDTAKGVIQRIREFNLDLVPRDPDWQGHIGGVAARPHEPRRLMQVDDRQYEVQPSGRRGRTAPGWLAITDRMGIIAVAVRDFWQRWPKSLAIDSSAARLGLFPAFTPGQFDHMQPWHKYGYLYKGRTHQLKTGQCRRWEVWLGLDVRGPDLSRVAATPLVPAADPGQAIATGAWGQIDPAGSEGMAEYDAWARGMDDARRESIRRQRDYGEMNWGDWFGERHVNWGNNEYDTSREMQIQFARTGDPRYYHAADAAARHAGEVDVVHFTNPDLDASYGPHPPGFPPRPGMMHEHCVGHVGGFCTAEKVRRLLVTHGVGQSKRPYLCLDPFNLGHVWTRGIARQHFLTGDPWLRETAELMGESLLQVAMDPQYPYFTGNPHSGRVIGWTMLALAGVYDLTQDRRYRRVLHSLADRALAEQDPSCGGWLYELPWGHCFCRRMKHVGEAAFITAIRLNGLAAYYHLTGDARIPPALHQAVSFLNADKWRADQKDWHYTSCPASGLMRQHGDVIAALVESARINPDPDHLAVLEQAIQARMARTLSDRPGAGAGKEYGVGMTGSAEAASLLASRRRKSSSLPAQRA